MPAEGTTALNATSTVVATSLVIKASPGTLYKITGFNGRAGSQYIQLHNAASLPADTAVPALTFLVAQDATFEISWYSVGRYFSTGIVVCNSSTAATKTIGSADCWFDAQYV